MTVTNRANAEHYTWGGVCDGWRMLDGADLSVTEERIPPGAGERRHVHQTARQLFYVLSGSLSIERGGETWSLEAGDALEIAPRIPHQVANTGGADVRFLVISAPSTRGDRTDLDEQNPLPASAGPRVPAA